MSVDHQKLWEAGIGRPNAEPGNKGVLIGLDMAIRLKVLWVLISERYVLTSRSTCSSNLLLYETRAF
jgi:hypothetical protein